MVPFHICIGVLNERGILDTDGTTVSSNSSTFVYNDQVLLDLTESFHLANTRLVSLLASFIHCEVLYSLSFNYLSSIWCR